MEKRRYKLRIDYFDGGQSAIASFRWRVPGSDKIVSIPPTAFSHDALDEELGDKSFSQIHPVLWATQDPKEYPEVVEAVLPGFSTEESQYGVVWGEHLGRRNVLRTHPIDQDEPCVLKRELTIPEGKKSFLVVSASHHPQGDWRLKILVNDKLFHDGTVGPSTTQDNWMDVRIDLTRYAGQTVRLELHNAANDSYQHEYAFWGGVRLEHE